MKHSTCKWDRQVKSVIMLVAPINIQDHNEVVDVYEATRMGPREMFDERESLRKALFSALTAIENLTGKDGFQILAEPDPARYDELLVKGWALYTGVTQSESETT